jgi:energy-coupling factor transport system permease protein
MAVIFSLRVLIFVLIALFVSFTTLPSDLAEALTGWLKPLRKLGVPADDIAMIVFIAIRFIPVLAEEFDTIRKAQTVRGVDFSGGLLKRIRQVIYLLVPVFRSALRRADDLALAMESRGYISGTPRTTYSQWRYRTGDIVFCLLSTAGFVLLYIFLG